MPLQPAPSGATWDAIVFDFDGVLVDSSTAIAVCLNHALRTHGLDELGGDAVRPYIGPPLPDTFARIVREQRGGDDGSLADRCVVAFRARYRDECVPGTTLQPGAYELVHRLATRVRLAIATSKPLAFTEPILEHLGLAGCFDAVAGPPLTPDPEPKEATLGRALAGLADTRGAPPDPAACVIVGDRSHDVAAGHALGLAVVGVTWGFGTEEELRTAGADHIVATPDELEAWLGAGRAALAR